jgi:hypothetical protein
MLKRVEPKQPFAISTQHCTGGEHFSVNQRPARQQPVEKPTVPIGPFHHRSDGKLPRVANHVHAHPDCRPSAPRWSVFRRARQREAAQTDNIFCDNPKYGAWANTCGD